uniref:Uncharacterized protein n=1 Tax=Arundo donax TaxID=35708 RepID=A0A0A9FX10_ARUDO
MGSAGEDGHANCVNHRCKRVLILIIAYFCTKLISATLHSRCAFYSSHNDIRIF